MIPDFSEFLASLDVDGIIKDLQKEFSLHLVQFQSDDQKSLETALQMTIDNATHAATAASVIIIQRYHQWLQQIL